MAAAALAAGATATAAATTAGVDERTVRRWLVDPKYRAKVDALRNEAVGVALAKMSGSMAGAADELRALLAHPDARVRLRACRAILELGVRLRDSVEMAKQLADQAAELAELRTMLTTAAQAAPSHSRRVY